MPVPKFVALAAAILAGENNASPTGFNKLGLATCCAFVDGFVFAAPGAFSLLVVVGNVVVDAQSPLIFNGYQASRLSFPRSSKSFQAVGNLIKASAISRQLVE
jgi:hypothetical protein